MATEDFPASHGLMTSDYFWMLWFYFLWWCMIWTYLNKYCHTSSIFWQWRKDVLVEWLELLRPVVNCEIPNVGSARQKWRLWGRCWDSTLGANLVAGQSAIPSDCPGLWPYWRVWNMWNLLYSSIFIYIHLYSSIFIYIHLYSSIFIYIHLYSSIFIYIHLYSSIFIDIHLYSSLQPFKWRVVFSQKLSQIRCL